MFRGPCQAELSLLLQEFFSSLVVPPLDRAVYCFPVSVGTAGKRLASGIKCLLALSPCLQLALINRLSRKFSSV